MSTIRGAVVGSALVAAMVLGMMTLPTAAQEPPIATELLTPRGTFADDVDLKVKLRTDGTARLVVNVDDPSHTVVGRFTVQPGARFPWHSHAGPVVVSVVSGELIYVDGSDCAERAYPAGTAFVDPGQGHVHSAFNATDGVTVLVATFFAAPAEGPLLIPADAPAGCS